MSSILRLAAKAAAKTSAWAWNNSGANNVPVLRGAASMGKNSLVAAKSMFTPTVPKKDAVEKNREANERAKEKVQTQQPSAEGKLTAKIQEDIHEIREILEKNGGLPGAAQGGSGVMGSLLGSKAVQGLLSKIPGIGKLAAGLAGGAGLLGVGKTVLGGLGGAAAGAGAATATAGVGSRLAEVARAGGRTALGVGRSIVDAGGGIVSAAGKRLTTVAEAGSSLVGKAATIAKESGTASVAKLAGKSGIKSLIKKIPAIGLLAGVGFGVQRAAAGDWTGAGMEVASGLAGTIPGPGTVASLGIDAALAAKDAGMMDSVPPQLKDMAQEPAQQAPVTPGATSREGVASGLASLQSFVYAAMDEKQGIFVRLAKNELVDNVSRAGMMPVSAPQTVTKKPDGTVAPTQPTQAPTQPGGVVTPVRPEKAQFAKIEPTTDLAKSELGNLISRGEGDYNSYNAGTKGTGGKVVHSGKKDLASMTLNEIIASSEGKDGNDKDRVFAAGRYQIITPTLKDSIKKMGLKGDEKFTPELQDKIFQETLLPKSVKDYVGGKSNDVQGAQIDLAKVWRSFADPRTGKTYADAGAGANHASISSKESALALERTREQVAKSSQFQLAQPEQRMSDTLKAETQAANKATGASGASQPVVIQVPVAQQSQGAPSSGGPAGLGGHMGTRNDDSSIRRITDAKMGYSMI